MGKKRKQTETKVEENSEAVEEVPAIRSSDEPPAKKVAIF